MKDRDTTRKKSNILRARALVSLAILLAVIASLMFDSGIGTPSAFGIGEFFLLCPLGGLETLVASKSFIPITLISLAVVVLLSLIFGRAWCAWGCPAPHIRHFFKRDPKPVSESDPVNKDDMHFANEKEAAGTPTCNAENRGVENVAASDSEGSSHDKTNPCVGQKRMKAFLSYLAHDKRTWVLAFILIATFVLAFPLFCLICPIGLTFGTVGSIWHLFVDKQITLSVIVFPLALIVELILYRKWCLSVCPIAGLLNIFGFFAKPFRPRVNATTCARSQGIDCKACTIACPERIDLHKEDTAIQVGKCTRCGECKAVCPTNSISMKLLAKNDQSVSQSDPHLRRPHEKLL